MACTYSIVDLLSIFLLGLPIYFVNSIPVDNGVSSDAEIACNHNGIVFSIATKNPFEGHVYVKGRYQDPGCRDDRGGRNTAGIELPFTDCGVTRTRSLNPKGIFVSTTVVVSFHPVFVTKVDRAYTIQCFYMEADKTVDTDIEVSMLTTNLETQNVPMPSCRYEILTNAGPNAEPVKYALIGQSVYHKWTCDTRTIDTFCLRVYSCFVVDLSGADRVDLLDADGCAIDKYLLNNLEYPSNLMAGVESHVFKYADRPQLYFQCQIEILVKEPNVACPVPQCPSLRLKRSAPINATSSLFSPSANTRSRESSIAAGTVDVTSPVLEPLELLEKQDSNNVSELVRLSNELYWNGRPRPVLTSVNPEHICLSPGGWWKVFSSLLALTIVLFICSLVLAIVLITKRVRRRSKVIA